MTQQKILVRLSCCKCAAVFLSMHEVSSVQQFESFLTFWTHVCKISMSLSAITSRIVNKFKRTYLLCCNKRSFFSFESTSFAVRTIQIAGPVLFLFVEDATRRSGRHAVGGSCAGLPPLCSAVNAPQSPRIARVGITRTCRLRWLDCSCRNPGTLHSAASSAGICLQNELWSSLESENDPDACSAAVVGGGVGSSLGSS